VPLLGIKVQRRERGLLHQRRVPDRRCGYDASGRE